MHPHSVHDHRKRCLFGYQLIYGLIHAIRNKKQSKAILRGSLFYLFKVHTCIKGNQMNAVICQNWF